MLFSNHDSSRFRIPGKQRSRCSKLRVGGRIVSDPDEVLGAWASHFKRLSESNRDAPGLSELEDKVEEMAAKSHANEEGMQEDCGCKSYSSGDFKQQESSAYLLQCACSEL